MDPEEPRDGFTISYMDDADEVFFIQTDGLEGVLGEIERALDDGGANQILIKRQGDEDD